MISITMIATISQTYIFDKSPGAGVGVGVGVGAIVGVGVGLAEGFGTGVTVKSGAIGMNDELSSRMTGPPGS